MLPSVPEGMLNVAMPAQINMISQWANLWAVNPAIKALPAVATTLTMMWVMRKIRHPAALPTFLIAVPLVFHAVLFIQGLTLADAADAGWVSHPTVRMHLSSLHLLWVPAFSMEVKPGLYPSRGFAIASYSVTFFGFLLSLVLADLVLAPTLTQISPGVTRNIYKLIASFIELSEICSLSFGFFSLFYIIYQREFLQKFILYDCSLINLSRKFQRRRATAIFLVANMLGVCAEPLFALLALIEDIEQPKYWPNMTSYKFVAAKWSLIMGVFLGAALVSHMSAIFPMLTNYLIEASTEHLRLLLSKHMVRFNQIKLKSRQKHNDHLELMVDEHVRRVMVEYSCDTLTMDWPDWLDGEREDGHNNRPKLEEEEEVEVKRQVVQRAIVNKGVSVQLNSQALLPPPMVVDSRPQSDWATLNNRSAHQEHGSTAGSLLFLYKNLIKNLSELKGLIGTYESKFGKFHVLYICVNGLVIAQFITTVLIEIRIARSIRSGNLQKNGLSSGPLGSAELGIIELFNSFVLRVILSVIAFVLSNLFIFLRCDRLPQQMEKTRSRLFKMNIDLACSKLEQRFEASRGAADRRPSQFSHLNNLKVPNLSPNNQLSKVQNDDRLDWQGLDKVWSLYDQVERMSLLANFRLTAGTYYSKKFLLVIFGREVSLVLLYIQIIDIYSFV